MKTKLTKLFSTLALVTLGLLLIVSPTLAIALPDSLRINSVYVYQHCLEADDQLYLAEYSINYGTNPNENVTEAYLCRLMDGADELRATSPYAFYDEGYGEGIVALYFSADDVVDKGMVWSGAYTMELVGNPTLTWLGSSATTAMGGALAYDAPVYTDETAESNSAAASDMTLLPAAPVMNDAYYFGDDSPFNILTIDIGTNGEWTGTYTWEYWNGMNWIALDDIVDGSTGFTAGTGDCNITFTQPDDWDTVTVSSLDLYWIRFRVVSFTNITTQPLGTQSWTNSTSVAPPSTSLDSFTLWSSSTSITETRAELTARIIYLADQLEAAWSTNMVDSTGAGSYLSEYGEAYFTSIIPYVKVMATRAFAGVTISPDWSTKEPPTTYAEDRADSVVGTPLDVTLVADWWGISRMWTSSLLFILGAILLLYFMLSPTSNYRPLVLLSTPLIIAGGYLGLLPMLLTGLLGFFAFALTIFTLFYHPSGA